jgi:hypothetical protein
MIPLAWETTQFPGFWFSTRKGFVGYSPMFYGFEVRKVLLQLRTVRVGRLNMGVGHHSNHE